jgi:hypothetical protein
VILSLWWTRNWLEDNICIAWGRINCLHRRLRLHAWSNEVRSCYMRFPFYIRWKSCHKLTAVELFTSRFIDLSTRLDCVTLISTNVCVVWENISYVFWHPEAISPIGRCNVVLLTRKKILDQNLLKIFRARKRICVPTVCVHLKWRVSNNMCTMCGTNLHQ